jgi:hypothetical protein
MRRCARPRTSRPRAARAGSAQPRASRSRSSGPGTSRWGAHGPATARPRAPGPRAAVGRAAAAGADALAPEFWVLLLGRRALVAGRRSLAVRKAWPAGAWRGIARRAGRATGTVTPLPSASACRCHPCLHGHAAAIRLRWKRARRVSN